MQLHRCGRESLFVEKAPHRAVSGKWNRTLTAKCRKKGVDIRTGTEVTEEMIDQEKPGVAILAMGAEKATCVRARALLYP